MADQLPLPPMRPTQRVTQTLDKGLLPIGVVVSLLVGFAALIFTGTTRAEKMEAKIETVDASLKLTSADTKDHTRELASHDRRIQRVEDALVNSLEILKEIRSDQKDLKGAIEDIRKKTR